MFGSGYVCRLISSGSAVKDQQPGESVGKSSGWRRPLQSRRTQHAAAHDEEVAAKDTGARSITPSARVHYWVADVLSCSDALIRILQNWDVTEKNIVMQKFESKQNVTYIWWKFKRECRSNFNYATNFKIATVKCTKMMSQKKFFRDIEVPITNPAWINE